MLGHGRLVAKLTIGGERDLSGREDEVAVRRRLTVRADRLRRFVGVDDMLHISGQAWTVLNSGGDVVPACPAFDVSSPAWSSPR